MLSPRPSAQLSFIDGLSHNWRGLQRVGARPTVGQSYVSFLACHRRESLYARIQEMTRTLQSKMDLETAVTAPQRPRTEPLCGGDFPTVIQPTSADTNVFAWLAVSI